MKLMPRTTTSTHTPQSRRVPTLPAAPMPVTQLVSRLIVRVVEGRLVPVRALVARAA